MARCKIFHVAVLVIASMGSAGCAWFGSTDDMLEEPVTVDDSGEWTDGVTYVMLTGSADRTLVFCVDGRPRSWTRGRIFKGATHPTHVDAEKVPWGSEDEQEILDYLDHWLAARFRARERREIEDHPRPWELGGDLATARRLLVIINVVETAKRGESGRGSS